MTTERTHRGFAHTEALKAEDTAAGNARPPGRNMLTSALSAPVARTEEAAKGEPEVGKGEREVAGGKAEPATEATSAKAEPANAKAQDSEAEAAVEDPAELAEAEAWLAEVNTAFAVTPEMHVCSVACAHAQFDRMMDAYAGPEGGNVVDQAALEQAYRAWQQKNKNKAPNGGEREKGDQQDQKGEQKNAQEPSQEADAPEGGEPAAPPPDLAAPNSGESVGHAGTVTWSKPAGFPGIMGLATWNTGNFTYPDLKLKTEQKEFLDHGDGPANGPGEGKKEWFTEVEPTTSADAATSAIATPAGTYVLPGTIKVAGDDGKKVVMTKEIQVGSAAAAQIKVAEQEHLDDVTEAYNITLKAAAKAVNDAVPISFSDKKKAASIKKAKDHVKDALDPKLTANPQTWRAMLTQCVNLTKSKRDASKWHTFDYYAEVPRDADFDRKVVTWKVLPNANVGTHPSSEIIKL